MFLSLKWRLHRWFYQQLPIISRGHSSHLLNHYRSLFQPRANCSTNLSWMILPRMYSLLKVCHTSVSYTYFSIRCSENYIPLFYNHKRQWHNQLCKKMFMWRPIHTSSRKKTKLFAPSIFFLSLQADLSTCWSIARLVALGAARPGSRTHKESSPLAASIIGIGTAMCSPIKATKCEPDKPTGSITHAHL